MLLIFLTPFSWLYSAVMRFRNFCYDVGWRKSASFDNAVITVGNLSVGGTGKTPMIEYLVRLLSNDYSLAILSRGYGRRTKGFHLAGDNDDASSIGDEPFQFYRKFKDKVHVCVCEDRVEGIHRLMELRANVQVILLDDAFQHRRVKPSFSILLTDFGKPFYDDFVLPKGRLREPRAGSSRSDVIVVTKCSELTPERESGFRSRIQHYSGEKPVFFSGIVYSKPISLVNADLAKDVILVTGIANSKPMVDYVSKKVKVCDHFEYPDHHEYTLREVTAMQEKAQSTGASLLTTEKDFVKLFKMVDKKLWFYLPMETRFVNNGSEFDMTVADKVRKQLRK